MTMEPRQSYSPTEEATFHRAVCRGCGNAPDLDGLEWCSSAHEARNAAVQEADWLEDDDGVLWCLDCRPVEVE
jgi:hypothetical protein